MTQHLAVLGASGHGKVIADAALLSSKWKKISFFDDAWRDISCDFPWSIVGTTEQLLETLDQFSGVVIGIGNNSIRQEKHKLLAERSAPMPIIIHPHAAVSSFAKIGAGSVVLANAVINIQASIGLSCIINTGATVDHECQLSDFVHISPGAHLGGSVEIGDRSWIGLGSSVKQSMTIGSDVIVGLGSAVVKSIANNQVVAGIPAKPL